MERYEFTIICSDRFFGFLPSRSIFLAACRLVAAPSNWEEAIASSIIPLEISFCLLALFTSELSTNNPPPVFISSSWKNCSKYCSFDQVKTLPPLSLIGVLIDCAFLMNFVSIHSDSLEMFFGDGSLWRKLSQYKYSALETFFTKSKISELLSERRSSI